MAGLYFMEDIPERWVTTRSDVLAGCLLADIPTAPGWRGLKMKGFSWAETRLLGFLEHEGQCAYFQTQSHPAALMGAAVGWISWDTFLLIRLLSVLWLM